ncbi:MAG: 6-phosphogluconolactonase [Acidobacteriota bacterium]|nr:6-phosphogluconolactonase [Acidobacteriota bacterium]
MTLPGDLELTDDVPAAFARCLAGAFAGRPGPRCTLVLSGGPTAARCYDRLAAETAAGTLGVDWSVVDLLVGDERCVPADDPDANQRMLRETLVERVGPVGSFHPMSCEAGPAAYETVLHRLAAPDLVHLGLGPDGHTASLFPGSAALEAPGDRWVVENEDPAGRNPHRRMTLTLAGIARARLVVFTVSGEEKRDAFGRARAGEDLPATRVRARRVLWLADPAAAG